MSESKVFGWKCPWSGDDSDPILPSYRIWFWLYRGNQVVRHRIGLHQKPRTYSIAPRCDWCGHRSPKQRAIAARNWDAMATPTPRPLAAEQTTPGTGGAS